jgi:poly(A) polymerase
MLILEKDAAQLRRTMSEDSSIWELAETFLASGHDFVVAGGAVRNALLGLAAADFDVSTDAPPAAVRALAASWADRVWEADNEVHTVSCSKAGTSADITRYRDLPAERGLSGLLGDLTYRDFRVNAIAVVLPSFELYDPFDGAADLAARVLRTPLPPRETFMDRPLRMLRAARFTASLGCTPATELVEAMSELAPTIDQARPAWLDYEIRKLRSVPNRDRALELLASTGVTAALRAMGRRLD